MAIDTSEFDRLSGLIERRELVLGVVGLGYVGLPLAMAGVAAGFRVLGFDTNPERVRAMNAGGPVMGHTAERDLGEAVRSGRFEATCDMGRLSEPDAILICVPTPLTRHDEPDLSFVVNTAEAIAARLRPGQLVALESTTWPGTTREVVQPIMERTGLKVGQEVFLAFSPEREDPGNAHHSTRTIPKIVGADDQQSQELAVALYQCIVTRVVPVSSAGAAEAAKLTENIYRAVNIALVNELKLIYAAMGLDVWEIIDAAATKPFGFTPFYPGPGMGGHCIPIDPFYLSWKAREFGMETQFIRLAAQINVAMPKVVAQHLAEALDSRTGRGLNGAKVLIVGVAYKRNVEDIRESPALEIIEHLEERGADCSFHDPFVRSIPPTRRHAGLSARASQPLAPDQIAAYDAVLIATDHDTVDYKAIAENARLVVDTRNVLTRLGLANDRTVKA